MRDPIIRPLSDLTHEVADEAEIIDERRPPRLDLAAYPHVPKMDVKTTCAADYAVLAA